ncbi:ATPase/DNA packaging protein [Chlorogloeopsis fritschii PCC 9212]|uniref:Uncharacterized protein n=1 Tax=Chlorogloeopsis fritschii PCC 6912 TaxID=211165 RepID=A0A433N1F5_CHLFR|nr:ATPase/DNA packaging protein [Chlorogloeopsis fritschii]MBF2007485.1 hypothetical protein [Chlorogloeopsis fritschii C42_A2020_084]RUR74842.1 hypothetical protein PCC6912_50200 [Chlorogloeopsis fritschii PCC 6912]
MKKYNIITLGSSGSGKTVFLASLFKQLSTQGEYGFFLDVDNPLQRKLLNTYYTEIIAGDTWPKGTQEITDWTFTCCVKTKDLSVHQACQFVYKDYPEKMFSGIAADESPELNIDLQREVDEADAVLAILDGQQILSLLQGNDDKLFQIWLLKELPAILNLLQKCKKIPVHFIISKWDLIINKGGFDLSDVRYKLLKKVPEFKNVVKQRNDAKCPVRIIPVSSLGMNFATFKDGEMKKLSGEVPQPFYIEVPLSCVLIDNLQIEINHIQEKHREISQRKTEVLHKFSLIEQVNQLVSNTVLNVAANAGRNLLPDKYNFDNDTLNKLLNLTDKGIQQVEQKVQRTRQEVAKAKAEAARESEKLRRQKEDSLKKVTNEETALQHIIDSFLRIRDNLHRDYPESDLGGAGV